MLVRAATRQRAEWPHVLEPKTKREVLRTLDRVLSAT
jgi:hypothetical protein